ncbi:MAG: RMD1 family protein [Gammaproteobacteria bacterium]
MTTSLFSGRSRLRARAVFLGERIDVRALEDIHRLASAPLAVQAGEHGCAVVFRYGAVVTFGLQPMEELTFMQSLQTLVTDSFEAPESEEAELGIDPDSAERVDGSGTIWLHDPSVERLQVVADILAKSVVLAHYEARIARVFDRIEPLAAGLQRHGRGGRESKELLRQIGDVLLVQHTMVGRVEVGGKPELLWERPELERLYLRLEDEYELHERHRSLDAKLDVIARTAETLLELLQTKRSLRVEWYIVILIVIEILLTLYGMFVTHQLGG